MEVGACERRALLRGVRGEASGVRGSHGNGSGALRILLIEKPNQENTHVFRRNAIMAVSLAVAASVGLSACNQYGHPRPGHHRPTV